ncbi:MAG TPA: hypothetical protein VN642_01145, partial [Dongiaceae bacterium]|nr:hypothetical protein [Dongiaceae bacterium]
DSVALGRRSRDAGTMSGTQKIHIGVLRLPRISNFTDFDPLQNEPDVLLDYIEKPDQLQGLDILIIPGSKSTIADLNFLKERGLFDAIRDFKGRIVGICGGFQMLGTVLLDPDGVESPVKEAQGLDLLPSTTLLLPEKETHQALAHLDEAGLKIAPECCEAISGYEIHMGVTTLDEGLRPFSRIIRRGAAAVSVADGAVSGDGRIFGTYLHGLFENSRFREIYLDGVRREKGMPPGSGAGNRPQPDPFDQLAEQMEKHLDLPRMLALCGLGSDVP